MSSWGGHGRSSSRRRSRRRRAAPIPTRAGIRWEATSWQELVAHIRANTPQALAQLGRSLPDLKHYWAESQELKRQYVTMTDRLYEAVFKLPTARDDSQGGKLRAVVPPEFAAGQHIVFKQNVRRTGGACVWRMREKGGVGQGSGGGKDSGLVSSMLMQVNLWCCEHPVRHGLPLGSHPCTGLPLLV